MQTTLTIQTESPEQATLLIEILAEVQRATDKHPVWPASNAKRACIITEKIGEIAKAINEFDEGKGDPENLRMEVVQTAATCIRMLYQLQKDKETKPTSNANVIWDGFSSISDSIARTPSLLYVTNGG